MAYSKESFNRFQGHEGGRKDRKKPSPVRRRIITTSAAPVTVEATTAVLPGTTSIQEYATSPVTEPVRIVEYQVTALMNIKPSSADPPLFLSPLNKSDSVCRRYATTRDPTNPTTPTASPSVSRSYACSTGRKT